MEIKIRDEKGRFVKGHLVLDVIRIKIRKANRGKNLGENNPFYGKTHSQEIMNKLENNLYSKKRGKNYEEIYGKEKAEDIKEKIKKAIKSHPITYWLGKSGKEHPRYIDGRSRLLAPGRYGDDWDKIRYLVYLRDRFTCQHCGVQGKRLDVHHKIPFLVSFDNSLSNLITLCRPCHMKEERKIFNELKNDTLPHPKG